jgi:hypothetical protein
MRSGMAVILVLISGSLVWACGGGDEPAKTLSATEWMSCLDSKDLKTAEANRAERESGLAFTVVWPENEGGFYVRRTAAEARNEESALEGQGTVRRVSNAVIVFRSAPTPDEMLDIEDCVK